MWNQKMFAVLGLMMVFQSGCAKKNNVAKTLTTRQSQTKQVSPSQTALPAVVDVAEPAKPATPQPAAQAAPVVVAQPAPVAAPAVTPTPSAAPAPVATSFNPMQGLVTRNAPSKSAAGSEAAPEAAIISLKVESKAKLMAVISETQKVMHKQKLVAFTSAEALIGQNNEDHFCRTANSGNLNEGERFKFENSEIKQTNKDLDLFETQLSFTAGTSSLTFTCSHTTSNFYVEDFAQNFQGILSLTNFEGKPYDLAKFLNPRTERRMVNAIKLKNLELMEKITLSEKAKEGFGISNGGVESIEKLSNEVAAGARETVCMVADVQGKLLKDTIYIRVDKGISADTPRDIPTATMFATYRADANNAFILTCLMKKTAQWSVLFEGAKEIFEFGVLDRLAYNKKFDEVKALHQKPAQAVSRKD